MPCNAKQCHAGTFIAGQSQPRARGRRRRHAHSAAPAVTPCNLRCSIQHNIQRAMCRAEDRREQSCGSPLFATAALTVVGTAARAGDGASRRATESQPHSAETLSAVERFEQMLVALIVEKQLYHDHVRPSAISRALASVKAAPELLSGQAMAVCAACKQALSCTSATIS